MLLTISTTTAQLPDLILISLFSIDYSVNYFSALANPFFKASTGSWGNFLSIITY